MSTPQDPYGPQSQQAGGYPSPGEGGYPAAPPPQPSGYPGGMSPPPRDYTGDDRPVGRPGVVVASVVLWVLTGLFFLLSGLVLALAGGSQTVQDQLDDAVAQSGVQIDPETLRQGVVVTGVVLAVLGALLVILPLLMLLLRSNAARILLTVLGVLVALLLLGTVVGTLVVLVAIVLQFLPPANAWFRSRPNAA